MQLYTGDVMYDQALNVWACVMARKYVGACTLEITWFCLNRWLKYLQLNSAIRDAGRPVCKYKV